MGIRVFIADDHAVVRRGLKQMVDESGDMNVVGEACNGVEAVHNLRQISCDVLLLDISMPERNGIDTLKQVRSEFPHMHVLMLSIHPEKHYAVRALRAGASGYLTKDCAPEEMLTAIRTVAAGKKYVSRTLSEQLVELVTQPDNGPAHAQLSDREFQTMLLIASGKGLSEIAEELKLSPKTVSVYRARVIEKLSLKNNADIAHYAVTHQLIE